MYAVFLFGLVPLLRNVQFLSQEVSQGTYRQFLSPEFSQGKYRQKILDTSPRPYRQKTLSRKPFLSRRNLRQPTGELKLKQEHQVRGLWILTEIALPTPSQSL